MKKLQKPECLTVIEFQVLHHVQILHYFVHIEMLISWKIVCLSLEDIPNVLKVNFFSGICKDLILGLGSTEDHTPCSLCTHLHWTTTLNFHNLDLLIGLRFLLNTNLGRSLNICLGHGLVHQPLQELGMAIQRQWWRHSILVMSVLAPHLPYTCIRLSTLVSSQECPSSILMNKFTNLFHRYDDFSGSPLPCW